MRIHSLMMTCSEVARTGMDVDDLLDCAAEFFGVDGWQVLGTDCNCFTAIAVTNAEAQAILSEMMRQGSAAKSAAVH